MDTPFGGAGSILYSDPRSPGPHSPALVLMNLSAPYDGLPSVPTVVDGPDGSGTAQLRRAGNFVWVTWDLEGEDRVGLVAGRGLSNKEVVAAARHVVVRHDQVRRITSSDLPDGFEHRGQAPITPDETFGGEDIALVSADGKAMVHIQAYDASPSVHEIQRFWLQQLPLIHPEAHTATREHGNTVIVASGDASRHTLQQLADHMAPVNREGWEEFRFEVSDLTGAALLPEAAGRVDVGVLEGHSGAPYAWAAGLRTVEGQAPTVFFRVVTPDAEFAGQGGGGPRSALDDFPSGLGALVAQSTGFGTFIVLSAPTTATRVHYRPSGADAGEAYLVRLTADPAHHYFVDFVNRFTGKLSATAYDATGRKIAHRSDIGCNTCP